MPATGVDGMVMLGGIELGGIELGAITVGALELGDIDREASVEQAENRLHPKAETRIKPIQDNRSDRAFPMAFSQEFSRSNLAVVALKSAL